MLPSSNPLVLVADDEPSMLELVARHLKTMEDPKLEVMEASDGDQAWQLAREHLPDLVVLDVMMPGMSGWEVCRKIREDVALAHTGVVMLTGIGENLNQMTSPLYGADAYIDKPFEFDELDEKVKNALSARAAQRDAVARPSPSAPSLGDHGGDAANVNGVAGPAQAAPKKKTEKKAPKKGAKKIAAKAKGPAKKGNAEKSKSATKKGAAKTKTAARTGAKGTKSPKPKHNKKEDTKMAAKKGAKKAAKKTAAKKTAKKGAKKKAK